MEKTGSINKRIADNTVLINNGRIFIHTGGKSEQGRVLFATGVSDTLQAFREAQTSKDSKTMVQAEQVFLKTELQYADKKDKLLTSSLNNAITDLGDALKVLPTVESSAIYKNTDKAFLTTGKDRVNYLPKDAFHKACNSHKTRLLNTLRTPGLSATEKELIKQRASNMDTAKHLYIGKQKTALGLPENAKTKSNDRER
jgi:uncharacterized protein YaaR (DUF327 family)